jgi:hypothetical protein
MSDFSHDEDINPKIIIRRDFHRCTMRNHTDVRGADNSHELPAPSIYFNGISRLRVYNSVVNTNIIDQAGEESTCSQRATNAKV